MDIATKTEVITMAFSRPVSEAKIEDGLINAIQVKHILPILGEDFYDAVILTPGVTALLVYLKPIVAHFVRYTILPDIFRDVSNIGINTIPGNNWNALTPDDLSSMRQSALDIAEIYVKALTKYLSDNTDTYPLYYEMNNPDVRINISGGIIKKLDSSDYEDIDDYYRNH